MSPGGRIGAGLGALLLALAIAIGAGTVLGVGPLAPSPSPGAITDPDEILARSLQAVLDADAVHLEGTLSGRVPGSLLGAGPGVVSLDGTTVALDVRPDDARTRAHVESPGLGVIVDAVTVWDTVYWRTDDAGPWTRASLGDASADAGMDLNPLTLVDRLRGWLALPGSSPTLTTVGCGSRSGWCREVALDAGSDPATILGGLLPVDRAGELPDLDVAVTLQADVDSLRPVRLVVDVTSADGTVGLRLMLEAGRWDEEVAIEEPPAGQVAQG